MSERMQFDYSRLRGKAVEKFRTLSSLAEKTGIRLEMISLAMNGKREFSQTEINTLCKALEIPPEEIGSYFFTE